MTCFYCKGDMTESTTTHFAELKNCIVIIKNVPCYKCTPIVILDEGVR